jgi:glucosamine--fructose-6-phosphate aminotransferase (isomerizing)
VYHQRLNLRDQLVLTISQSGHSHDLIEFTAMARAEGALTASIVNDVLSPVAAASEIVLPRDAGPETSVAATKSFISTLAALLRLAAHWANDHALCEAIERLPARLVAAANTHWDAALAALSQATCMATIGRGPTLAIAREAALKLKEICDLQAEPFSCAEFRHGPMALVTSQYPVLLFVPNDDAASGLRELATDLRAKGATVLIMGHNEAEASFRDGLAPDHADADAVCLMQTFYMVAVRLAKQRGVGQHPRHLHKVTRTR